MEFQSSVKEPDIIAFSAHLRAQAASILSEMHVTKQNFQSLRTDTKTITHLNNDSCDALTLKTLDELERLEKEFRTLVVEEKTELSFLKQQFTILNQEKMKVEQSVNLLGSRVLEIERQVGIELTLPVISEGPRS